MPESPTDEIRAIRHELAARIDNDLRRIVEDLCRQQRASGRVYIQAVRIKTLGVLLIFLTSPADRGGRNHRTPVIDIEETVCLSSRFTSGF